MVACNPSIYFDLKFLSEDRSDVSFYILSVENFAIFSKTSISPWYAEHEDDKSETLYSANRLPINFSNLALQFIFRLIIYSTKRFKISHHLNI